MHGDRFQKAGMELRCDAANIDDRAMLTEIAEDLTCGGLIRRPSPQGKIRWLNIGMMVLRTCGPQLAHVDTFIRCAETVVTQGSEGIGSTTWDPFCEAVAYLSHGWESRVALHVEGRLYEKIYGPCMDNMRMDKGFTLTRLAHDVDDLVQQLCGAMTLPEGALADLQENIGSLHGATPELVRARAVKQTTSAMVYAQQHLRWYENHPLCRWAGVGDRARPLRARQDLHAYKCYYDRGLGDPLGFFDGQGANAVQEVLDGKSESIYEQPVLRDVFTWWAWGAYKNTTFNTEQDMYAIRTTHGRKDLADRAAQVGAMRGGEAGRLAAASETGNDSAIFAREMSRHIASRGASGERARNSCFGRESGQTLYTTSPVPKPKDEGLRADRMYHVLSSITSPTSGAGLMQDLARTPQYSLAWWQYKEFAVGASSAWDAARAFDKLRIQANNSGKEEVGSSIVKKYATFATLGRVVKPGGGRRWPGRSPQKSTDSFQKWRALEDLARAWLPTQKTSLVAHTVGVLVNTTCPLICASPDAMLHYRRSGGIAGVY